jgi:hypothetical protein
MDDPQVRSGDDVGAVEKSTRQVLAAVFENLKTSAGVKADGPTRLFFPNGIELISVVVKLNVKEGIDVEVKIAGEKGIKGAIDGARRTAIASRSPVIRFLDPAEVALNWEGSVRIVGNGFDTQSFALFDAAVPRTLQATETIVEVNVTKDITGKAGDKSVEIHTGEGTISNTVRFTVRGPKTGM